MRYLILTGIAISLVYATYEPAPAEVDVKDSSIQVSGDDK